MILYLKDDPAQAEQLLSVLNSVVDSSQNHRRGSLVDATQNKRQRKHSIVSKEAQKQFFDIILTKEHCIINKAYRVICRNKELLLDGRSLKNILFIANEVKDTCLVH